MRMTSVRNTVWAAAAMTTALASIGSALAAPELPATIAVTASAVGSSGYSQAVAVGAPFTNNYVVTVRVLPGQNDVSPMVQQREGKVAVRFTRIGPYFSTEGVNACGT